MKKSRILVMALAVFGFAGIGPAFAADVLTITHGREVSLEDNLVPGKYVLFDFYADWCGPCRQLEPRILELAGRNTDQLAVRKIDIINWDSPVARQYGLSSIPHLILYGPDGSRLAAGDASAVLGRLESRLGRGPGRVSAPDSSGSTLIPLLAVVAIFAVAVGLVARKRRPAPSSPAVAEHPADLAPVDTTSDPGDPAIWFTLMQGSLEGPYTRSQLSELLGRGVLEPSSTVRRRGDATWTTITDAID